jgi:DNA-binding SARP family transcriptional activator
LRVGRPISMDALVDAVWGDQPPRSAVNSAQSYVSRLRGLLGPAVLAWTGTGYELRAEPAAVDAHRFEALIERARSAADAQLAIGLLDEALALWNDHPFPDLAHYEPAMAQAARLAELSLTGRELRTGAMLAAGQARAAIASLYELTLEFPLREQPWQQFMSALHRTGQQADALAAFRRYDQILAEQGLEPQRAIRELRTAILATPDEVRVESSPQTTAAAPAPRPCRPPRSSGPTRRSTPPRRRPPSRSARPASGCSAAAYASTSATTTS